jgi:ABC-type cobalamin/Fe3+-siderophores transport system ATPase subunit
MTKLQFIVVQPRARVASVPEPCFVLEQDNWNDHLFRTQYHLTYWGPGERGQLEKTEIGAVKILRAGQVKTDPLLITSNFYELDDAFCSVGQSLDYYQRLSELKEVGQQVLRSLRDVVAHPDLLNRFDKEPGWSISLFRDQADQGKRFRMQATGLVQGHYDVAAAALPSFSFTPRGWSTKFEFDASTGEAPSFKYNGLPDRVNILVGRNGCGKSTVLARLARIAYASPSARVQSRLKELGELAPEGIGFTRIVTVAFSPFDSFLFPTTDERDQVQVLKEMQQGRGRYTFIGLRDLLAEVEANNEAVNGFVGGSQERQAVTRLKSIEKLADEFIAFVRKIVIQDRQKALGRALKKMGQELADADTLFASVAFEEAGARKWFIERSTGHKIALLVVLGLVANLEPYSLVLIDEPETHLHPPLLAGLMHALRETLSEFDSSAVVATHSPVVVQESLARHVHLVRREDDSAGVYPLADETFGESIGHITSQVFGLQSDVTDYHSVLDGLVSLHSKLESIEALFLDGSMSNQARAYVMSRMADAKRG